MKKKLILTLTAAAVSMAMITGCGSSSETATTEASQTESEAAESTEAESTESEEDVIGMANPWIESDEQGVLEATGFDMKAPEGATDVAYSYIPDNKLAQMQYVLDDINWTYRMEPSDELMDISGMYYGWTEDDGDKGTVSGREAVYYGYLAPEDSDEESAQLVNWYDAVTGVTYSLSAVAKDLDGMDIQAYAEKLYVPLQGEATDDPEGDRANELKEYFIGEHESSYDGSKLTISDNGDDTFNVNIDIFRLCSLENAVGTFENHKINFEAEDPNGNKMTGMIYRDSDNSLTVRITDSSWDLLPTDETIEGFGR